MKEPRHEVEKELCRGIKIEDPSMVAALDLTLTLTLIGGSFNGSCLRELTLQ